MAWAQVSPASRLEGGGKPAFRKNPLPALLLIGDTISQTAVSQFAVKRAVGLRQHRASHPFGQSGDFRPVQPLLLYQIGLDDLLREIKPEPVLPLLLPAFILYGGCWK